MSVIIGYQGIGKSTVSKESLSFIDLESSNFRIDGKRADDWYKPYGNIALDLSRQGYGVFTASHAPLREWLGTQNKTGETIFVCYPATWMKDFWIDKLQKRYDSTHLPKDYAALMNAKDRYVDNINEIIADADKYWFYKIELGDYYYDLKAILRWNIQHFECKDSWRFD